MITVTVSKKNSSYTEFVSRGHAGYAEEGQDIICAAVSALIISTVNSLETLTKDHFRLEDKDGYVRNPFSGGAFRRGKTSDGFPCSRADRN